MKMKSLSTACAVAMVAAAMAVSACGSGSNDDTGGSSSSTAAAGAAVEQAQSRVDALRAAPKPLAIPALTRQPARDRTAYWISCKLPECDVADASVQEAMRQLGWRLTTLKTEVTPEAIIGAWNRAVAADPDVILAVGLGPDSLIERQLKQADADGVRVVMASSPSSVGTYGIDATIASRAWYDASTVGLVDWAVADSGGDANMVVLYDQSLPLQSSAFEAARRQAKEQCGSCTLTGLPMRTADIGKAVPGQVVSHLQKDPDVDYVLTVLSSDALGVGQAIKAAGLSAKVGTAVSQQQNIDAVAKGVEAVAIPTELLSLAWRMSDAAVRLVEGEQLPASLANPKGAMQLFDASNVDEAPDTQWDVPDIESTFLSAWQLG